MVVIYAEKSSLAKEIAGALGAGKRIAMKEEPTVGYYSFKFHGEDAVLCHGVGHLAQLVPAKSYDEKFSKWDLNVFPCIPDKFRCAAKSQTINCIKLVRNFLNQADWAINATDADREGELIFAYVCDVCNFSKPVKRVWIEDLTDAKICKAFNNLKDQYQQLSDQVTGCAADLQNAGRARDLSDWLIGTNLTVACTKKFGSFENLISIGRVQTPTLNLVVEREKQILSHKKTPFWKVFATFNTENGSFKAEHENGNYDSESEANAVIERCKGINGIITEKKIKNKTVSAPLLYNATQLQIAASKKLGWNADKTMSVMQKLYEHKLMSYPRTSSEHLTEAMKPEVKETISKIFKMPEYSQYALSEDEWNEFSKRHFDDSKVGSHPAIIPTVNVPADLTGISDDEKLLYDMLVKSIIRIVYRKAEINDTNVLIKAENDVFKASGSEIINPGWYNVDGMPEQMNTLPAINENDSFPADYEVKKGETEPPKRYTEATLLAAMELAGNNIDDEEIRTLMKMQKKGLGTDATRVAILQGLFTRGYIERKGKSIIPTEKGFYLIDNLPVDELKSADMTGDWEKKLNDVALGKYDYNVFAEEIKQKTLEWYNLIVNSAAEKYVSEKESLMICPLCKEKVNHLKWGYGCSGYSKGCKFSINNEICGKKLTESQVVSLLSKGKTNVIKGFTGKSGKEFDASLVLDRSTGKIGFSFPAVKSKTK